MSVTKSAKGLFWAPGETIELSMSEMPYENKYGDVVEWVIGKKKFEHFILDDQTGKKNRVNCEGMGKCTHCTPGNKATIKFMTIARMDGKEFYCDMGASLTRMIGERMHQMTEMGIADADALATVFIVRKLPDRPYWQVNIRPRQAPKPAPVPTQESCGGIALTGPNTVKGTPAPVPKALVTAPVDDLDLEDDLLNADLVATVETETKLTAAEVDKLAAYEDALKKKLASNPKYAARVQIANALKVSGWSSKKIEAAHAFYDYTTGKFTMQSGSVEA